MDTRVWSEHAQPGMLRFHHAAFEDMAREPGALLVLGRGLGDWRVLVQTLRLCCCSPSPSPSSSSAAAASAPLTLVLNADSRQPFAQWRELCEWWGGVAPGAAPRMLDAETLSGRRQRLYAEGGCFFITSRVLVADLLNGICPPVAAVVVLRAHKVTESSNEAFAIRMIKERGKDTKVWAFSDAPERISGGLSKLSKLLEYLFVKAVVLYPRFRQEVRDSLDASSPKLTEIAQPLSDAMKELQSALVDTIRMCVEEVRKSSSVDMSDLTVESVLFRNFDRILRYKRASAWATVSIKVKRLMDDLTTLRHLLGDLLALDCVSFYEKLLDIRKENVEAENKAAWLSTTNADRVFRAARKRVYTIENANQLCVVLEPHLKMVALKELLDDIHAKGETSGPLLDVSGGVRTLVLARSEHTLEQIRQHMSLMGEESHNSSHLMDRRFYGLLKKLFGKKAAGDGNESSSTTTYPSSSSSSTSMPLTVEMGLLKQEFDRLTELRAMNPQTSYSSSSVRLKDADFHPARFVCADPVEFLARDDVVALHTFDDLSTGLLDMLKPGNIVVFEPDVGVLREIECYHALHLSAPSHVNAFVMYFETSVEEQRHLSTLNQERDVFLRLVEEKSDLIFADIPTSSATTTVAPLVLMDGAPSPQRLEMNFYDAASGEAVHKRPRRDLMATSHHNKVIVDTRELRSALPNMLHSAGVVLDVRTLEVGDYILSREICVERKSLADLTDSLKTGRLFNQATMMTRHYKKPCLLIEFPEDGPFRLQTGGGESSSAAASEAHTIVMSRLTLLTLHFPDLKIIWSKNPRATVDLFRELQRNQQAPDGDLAESIERTAAGIVSEAANIEALEVLKRVPGITKDNVFRVARIAGSLHDLCALDLETLVMACEGHANANHIYDFLNETMR